MSKYKYELAKELLLFLEGIPFRPEDKLWDSYQKFPEFTNPLHAWAFLEKADWLGTTLKPLCERDKTPTSIMEWAEFVKSRDGFALVASCTTVGQACSELQDLIYAMEHGEAE